MNNYDLKRRWKLWLGITAVAIIIGTLIYTNYLVGRVAKEEQKKVELWADAILNRARLVNKTDSLFKAFEKEDRKNIELWAEANKFIAMYDGNGDITFPTKVISNNTIIPVIITNAQEEILFWNNLPREDSTFLRTELQKFKEKNKPIDVSYRVFDVVIHQYLYYDDSYIYSELKTTFENLIESFISETVINSASVPVVFTNEKQDSVVAYGNLKSLGFTTVRDNHAAVIGAMRGSNMLEVELGAGRKNYIFYRDSYIISLLKYFPYIFLATIALFLLVAYILFSTARRSEQNQVWVGMSKETAHQLGTPLTSLIGWVEVLRMKQVDEETISEIEKDIQRLNIVADRFSKVGSTPVLKDEDLHEVLSAIIDYMRKRTSSRITYTFNYTLQEKAEVPMNRPLFEWVLENLFRNSIDAITAPGDIRIDVAEYGKYYVIDVTDTGKGIPKNQFKSVFRPGYTTKKRGWGLGLSLTRRIINEYHNGKIFVKSSEAGKGTTFRILLLQ